MQRTYNPAAIRLASETPCPSWATKNLLNAIATFHDGHSDKIHVDLREVATLNSLSLPHTLKLLEALRNHGYISIESARDPANAVCTIIPQENAITAYQLVDGCLDAALVRQLADTLEDRQDQVAQNALASFLAAIKPVRQVSGRN